MFAVLAEDESDVKCLSVLIKRIAKTNLSVRGHGFKGGGNLLNKGAAVINNINRTHGVKNFIICIDSDGKDVATLEQLIQEKVIDKVATPKDGSFCRVIATQEIEAWVLADVGAVSKVIPSIVPEKTYPRPEAIRSPKEELEKLSISRKAKPLYVHNIHNQKIMEHVSIADVYGKCGSFKVFHDFVVEKITP